MNSRSRLRSMFGSMVWLALLPLFLGAKPTINAPSAGQHYASDATFDAQVSGTMGSAITVGVWDVGEEAFVETHNATLGATPVNVTFNSGRNEWNMNSPPGTPDNAQVRAWYQSSPSEYAWVGIDINESPP